MLYSMERLRRILDDLSSADATLKAAGTDPLALAAAATLQAQQAAALHQAAAGSLANHALIPGLLQGMQSLAAGISTPSSTSNVPIPHQIMMQPLQQSLQLQSALLSAASNNPGPLIAGSVQSLAGQTNIPASILSNAINMAASLSNSSATNSILASSGHPSMLSVNTSSLTSSPGQPPLGGQAVPDEQGKKREIRLMKNRWEAHGSLLHDKKQLLMFLPGSFSLPPLSHTARPCMCVCACASITSHASLFVLCDHLSRFWKFYLLAFYIVTMSAGPTVNNLFPAIAQSFAVILVGYLIGLFKIIPPGEARAISELVGKLALPALLFQNLATLNLGAIDWRFMSGILIAKLSVFILTVILTLILSRKNVGKAGLFGIFTTQSNDFALGLPIVQALYGPVSEGDQFNYASYMYLLAPISLVIINPVGFLMMEYWKQSHKKPISFRYVPKLLFNTLKGVVLNPIVFMTATGIVYNLVVHFGVFHGRESSQRNIPHWLGGFLTTLGNAYAACALLQIGIFMVGKVKKTTGMLIIISALLIFAKTILLPIVADRVLYLILPHESGNITESRSNISTFGFLYGTFPTAPTVFVFSNQYNIATDVVSCFFNCSLYLHVCSYHAWVYLLFICARRYRSYLHVMVMHYMAALILEAVGGSLLALFTMEHQVYWQIFAFSLFFPGVLASRIWTAWIALGLTLLLYKRQQVAEKLWIPLMLSAWGVPIVVTVVMVVICTVDPSKLHDSTVDSTFLFGNVELVVSAITLLFSFIVGLFFMVASALKIMNQERNIPSTATKQNEKENYNENHTQIPNSYGSTNNFLESTRERSSKASDSSCSLQSLGGTKRVVETREEVDSRLEQTPLLQSTSSDSHKSSTMQFLLLLLFLLFSCLVGILIVLWKLISGEISGIFIGVNVLDTTTNFGQGFFVFIVFGFERHWFWMALYKRVRRILFKIESVHIPVESDLSSTVKALCLEFKQQHLAECRHAIESDKRYEDTLLIVTLGAHAQRGLTVIVVCVRVCLSVRE
ncbi:Integral membrane protein GPR155, partial [Geodia barretti]